MNGNFQTIQEFVKELERTEALKEDYMVPARKAMIDEKGVFYIHGVKESFQPNELFHGQLADKLGIPRQYYNRMRNEFPTLLATNVNGWLSKASGKNLVRTVGPIARAFLSDRYKRFDHLMMLEAVMPSLVGFPDVQVRAVALTDVRMYLQFVFPRIQAEIVPGDIVQAGVTLTNSETGQGAVDVSSFVHVLKCKNGLVGESILNRYHTGRRFGGSEEDYGIYRDDTIRAEIESLKLRVRDVLTHALTESAFQGKVNRLREAAGVPIHNPIETVENVTKRYSFSKEEQEEMLRNLVNGKDMSIWGLSNAITALAHTKADPDRQYEYEIIGNRVIEEAKELVA